MVFARRTTRGGPRPARRRPSPQDCLGPSALANVFGETLLELVSRVIQDLRQLAPARRTVGPNSRREVALSELRAASMISFSGPARVLRVGPTGRCQQQGDQQRNGDTAPQLGGLPLHAVSAGERHARADCPPLVAHGHRRIEEIPSHRRAVTDRGAGTGTQAARTRGGPHVLQGRQSGAHSAESARPCRRDR